MFYLEFGVDVYAPRKITRQSLWTRFAITQLYHDLFLSNDIEKTRSGGYIYSTRAMQIIIADAIDYASYHTSLYAKKSPSPNTATYKSKFSHYFHEWVGQYLPGTRMNILHSTVPGAIKAQLTDGDPKLCK
jgi:hypothetical protein